MRVHRIACQFVALLLFVGRSASAELFVSEPFDGSPGPVDGTGGGSGFAGNYAGAGTIVAPGYTYPNLVTSGNRFVTAGNNGAVFRDLATPIDTDAGTVYAAFLAAPTQSESPERAGISFYSGGRAVHELLLGKPFDHSTGEAYGFDVTGEYAVTSDISRYGRAPTLLVYRLTFTDSGERVDLFMNPRPGAPLPTTPTITGNLVPEGTFADTFTSIRIQSGGAPEGQIPFGFDELRIGTTFEEVAFPEPAGVVPLAAASLLAARRRARYPL